MNSFQSLLTFLFGKTSPEEKQRRRLLKQITKDIKQSRYKTFYKTSTRNIMPDFALIMFDFNNTFTFMRASLAHAEQSEVLKQLVVDEFLNDHQKSLIDHLDISQIKKEGCEKPSYELERDVKGRIENLCDSFNEDLCLAIDKTYRQLISFVWLVNYDYFTLLQKLDTQFVNATNYKPHFYKINIGFVAEDIKDFLSIVETFDMESNWELIFKILKNFNVQNLITVGKWQNLLKRLHNILYSRILILIICHGEDDPYWNNNVIIPHKRISKEFLNETVDKAEEELETLTEQTKSKQIKGLLKKVFDTEDIPCIARYYTEETEKNIARSDALNFTYTEVYNWLLVFESTWYPILIDICDMIIVYGESNSRAVKQDLSTVLQDFTESNAKFNKFDSALSGTEEYGAKLKYFSTKVIQGQQGGASLAKFISKINSNAKEVIESELSQLKKIKNQIHKFSLLSGNTLTGEIKNWRTIQKMLKEKKYDLENIALRMDNFFNLMKYAGFDIDTTDQSGQGVNFYN
ncbi:MAG: hypothetical protein Ta2F_03230 [Termitinemataceae bacterium]|nr:MAG: hypothetical protein Ta2F_03230 [Termitinemataceae bacterium]